MIKRFLYLSAIALFVSCNNEATYQKAEDAQDAGREFIRASLDGDYDKARFFLLKNEDNLMLLDRWKEMYRKYSQDTVRAFKNADIRPISIEALNDSTTLYTYSNSFTKDTTALKVVRVNGEWLVDLKTFIGD
ncbi:MAG TPA: hypothetical protein VGD17_11475 [Chitinophagaceae bacterium]